MVSTSFFDDYVSKLTCSLFISSHCHYQYSCHNEELLRGIPFIRRRCRFRGQRRTFFLSSQVFSPLFNERRRLCPHHCHFRIFASSQYFLGVLYCTAQRAARASRRNSVRFVNSPLLHNVLADKLPAGLTFDTPIPYEWHTPYNGENQTLADELWANLQPDIDAGLVALTDEYTKANDLLYAQRFPWEKDMGIYFLNGLHSMHCLVSPAFLCKLWQ